MFEANKILAEHHFVGRGMDDNVPPRNTNLMSSVVQQKRAIFSIVHFPSDSIEETKVDHIYIFSAREFVKPATN